MSGMTNSDEIYNPRNTIIYYCDKSAIDKHLNRLATVNVYCNDFEFDIQRRMKIIYKYSEKRNQLNVLSENKTQSRG